MIFFKIRQQKRLWIAWSKRPETFLKINVKKFHLRWKVLTHGWAPWTGPPPPPPCTGPPSPPPSSRATSPPPCPPAGPFPPTTWISGSVGKVGNGISFRKIPRNRVGTVSVIPRKKVLIPRHSEFRRRANSEARNEWNRTEFREKWSFLELARLLWSLWQPLHSTKN